MNKVVVASISPETSPESKKQATKARKPRLIANVLNTEYDVIKDVLKKNLHLKLSYEPEDEKALATKEWDLYWHDLIITSEMLTKIKPYQKVNHFPGMECLFRKNLLGKNLMRMYKLFPKEYSFFPPTWLLPLEWNDFKKQFNEKKAKTFIVKPEALSQGKGIFLTRDWTALDPAEHCVVQRYLHKPFLIDGLKFDLRIYVLVYGCDPYRIYMYKEGLARLATEQYTPPTGSNMENLYIHLTNYAINKDNENFLFNTDADKADIGHKRSLDFVWRYIDQHGGDSKTVRNEIKKCIIKAFCAVQPWLAHVYRSCQPNDMCNNKCFELLGFDILLDHKLKPWLLEVNHAPSFSTDTPFDLKIKSALLTDTFHLLKLDTAKRLSYERKKLLQSQVRLVASKLGTARLTREEKLAKKAKKMKKRDEYELHNLGNYERIYPTSESYEHYIKAAAESWDGFTNGKKKKLAASKGEGEESKKTSDIGKSLLVGSSQSSQCSSKVVKKFHLISKVSQENSTCANSSMEPAHPMKSNYHERLPQKRLTNTKPVNPTIVAMNPSMSIANPTGVPANPPAISGAMMTSAANMNPAATAGTNHSPAVFNPAIVNMNPATVNMNPATLSIPLIKPVSIIELRESTIVQKMSSRTECTRKSRKYEGTTQVFPRAYNQSTKSRPKTRNNRVTSVPPYVYAPEPAVQLHKYTVQNQANSSGVYVVPKVLEFVPLDIVASVREGLLPSSACLNLYKAIKPY